MKKALCIGINYRGSEYELGGCLNDADDWASVLQMAGFDVAVMDEQQATKRNMITGIEVIATRLKPGDVGVITFSGHGTWVPDINGDEPDGRDEALCPIDCEQNLIIDDELHEIFDRIPEDAHVVFVADCCHSGSVFRAGANASSTSTVRFVPPAYFTHTGVQTDILHRAAKLAVTKPIASDDPLPRLVHFGGCKDDEFSNDVVIGGRPCGAFSYYATRAVLKALKGPLTYGDVIHEIHKKLPSPKYNQSPVLCATNIMRKRKIFVG